MRIYKKKATNQLQLVNSAIMCAFLPNFKDPKLDTSEIIVELHALLVN